MTITTASALVTRAASRRLVNLLVEKERAVAFVAGAVMTGVSLYYLIAVFEIPARLLGR